MTTGNTAPIQDLAVIDATAELVVRRPPALVLDEAHKAAIALKDVLDKKPKKIVLNGEQYLEFEDWQTIGRFYGITAKITSTAQVRYGDVTGFTAHAVALRADGFELSAADADCLTDEEKWRSRARYEYQNGQRVRAGTEPVPLFQLKSMAQTRACAKVLRNVLAWVVVLAGYRATPAEELEATDGDIVKPAHQAAPPASRNAPAPAAAAGAPTSLKVTAVTTKKGKNQNGEWTNYRVTFSDGRVASTFDKTLGAECEAARADGRPVHPRLEAGTKGLDLKSLHAPAPAPAAAAEPPRAPDEPVNGPEKVLTARKVTRQDSTVYYVIQTQKRELLTEDAAQANAAVAARKAKLGIVPKFTVGTWAGYGQQANILQSFDVETPSAPAAADVVVDMTDAREPGQEG
jgi:hypothetical protein